MEKDRRPRRRWMAWRLQRPMDTLAANVLNTARAADPACRLISMASDAKEQTLVRLRAGNAHSGGSLQRVLQASFPLSLVEVDESFLDGTLEASITIFSHSEERARARRRVTRSRFLSYPLLMAWACVLLGVGDWLGGLRATTTGKDEL